MSVLHAPYFNAFLGRLRQWLLANFTFSEPELLFGGSVRNAAGEPIAFAGVTLKGTRYESETNAAGHFLLHVPLRLCKGPLCLKVSARGFTTIEEVIGGAPEANLDFRLAEFTGARIVPFNRKPVRKTS